jgi:hypothetical protein
MTKCSGLLPIAAISMAACAPSLPTPPVTAHGADVPLAVPYPPPPPRVEDVGEPPDEDARWVDGSWQFEGLTYVWTPGGWHHPPPGKAYARPLVVRRANGELVYFPGRWIDTSGPQQQP